MRWVVGAILVILAAVWLRVALSAREELAVAQGAEAAGDLDSAITHYQYALRWYTPLASAPAEAADRLDAMGDLPNRTLALRALRQLRGGILATRSVISPFGDRLPAVNRRLARLTAETQLGQPSARGRTLEALEAHHLALLELDPTPTPGWALLVVLGFIGWVTGAGLFIARGLDREARVIRRPALKWAAMTVVCLAVWIVALVYA